MAVGPVEYLVAAFPGSRFTGAITPAPDDLISQLERLGELKKQGALTDAEFAAQKNRLLAE